MKVIETLNIWSQSWAEFLWTHSIDALVTFVVVGVLWLCIQRKVSPQLGYCLFLLVLLKLAMPIEFHAPGWISDFSPQNTLKSLAYQNDFPAIPESHLPFSRPNSPGPEETTVPPNAAYSLTVSNPDNRHAIPAVKLSTVHAKLTYPSWLMVGWLLVVVSLLLSLLWSQKRTRRMIQQSEPLGLETIPWNELKRLAGLRRTVRLLSSASVTGPAACGIIHPVILVPPDFLKHFSPNQIQWILLHELAHIRRADVLVALGQKILQILYFFNPVVWLVNWIIDKQREYVCDDTALAVGETPRQECGEAFVSLMRRQNSSFALANNLVGTFSHKIQIRRRIMRILDTKRTLHAGLSKGALGLLILTAVFVMPSVQADNQAINPTSVALAQTSTDSAIELKSEPEIPGLQVVAGSIPAAGGTLPGKSMTRPQLTLRLLQEKEIGNDKRLSPDGLKMVYCTYNPSLIVVSDLSTGAERKYEQAVSNWVAWVSPVWSPDGKRIAFLDGKSAAKGKDQTVSILTLDSGDVEKTDIRAMPCDWSGDGRFLLVLDLRGGEKSEGLQLVDLKTGEAQAAIRPFNWDWWVLPRLSPDGRCVVYHGPRDHEPDNINDLFVQNDIFVQKIGADEPIRIASHKDGAWYPLWTADGKHILFMSNRDLGRPDLYSIAFQDGKPMGEPEIVVSDIGRGVTLYSCSNSGRLLFCESDKWQGGVFSSNIDPVSGNILGEPYQLTHNESEAGYPVWSRNGQFIAYYETTESGDRLLCVINSDGHNKKILGSINTFGRRFLLMAWHPDNDHILYPGREADPENPEKTLSGIYAVSIRTQERKLIYHDPEFKGGMDISPDGKHLALTSGSDENPQLYIVDYDGQNRRQLVSSGSKIRKPSFTPDGKEIIYTVSVSAEGSRDLTSIMAVSIDGGEPREIYASEDPNEGFDTIPSSWLPDGRFVFDIIRRTHGDRPEYAINMDGKSDPVKISDYIGDWYSVSPNGTRALFARRTRNSKLWLMSDFLSKTELAQN